VRREAYWHHPAVESIAMLASRNSRQATRILLAIREFATSGRGDLKKLQGSERWRLRVGDWRIGLKLEGDIAWILDVADRQDAYS
jgi:mRNA-degrading endonuclease RelE of RelBE toxin-antitoxin system